MAQQYIDFGSFPDDPDADAIRTAFQKVQTNFNELFATTTAGSVTSVNRGAGITVNSPTGNVIVTANIAAVTLNTNSLRMGTTPANSNLTATITQTSQAITIDIDPANVFSNNFAGVYNASTNPYSLSNITGTLTSNSNSQPNITSVGTLTSLAVTGNVTAGNVYANSGTIGASLLTGTLTTGAQPNITTIGTLGNLNVTSNSNLGNLATANFFSGDGYLLSNLTISAGSSIINGNSNVTVGVNGNVTTSVAGNSNILTVTGTGANVDGYLTASGNITGANATLGNSVTANYFIGSGANLTSLAGANVTGTVANATYATSAGSATSATTAGTVTTNAQPNITSVGTLTSLAVNGNITAANITANTGVFTGNGSGLTNLAGANVTGTVANATYATSAGSATSATTAGTVTTNAQPNITSIGTLSSLTVTGDITTNTGKIVAGQIGNTDKSSYIYGDGSNLVNISVTAGSTIVNGTSNVSIPASNGNVNAVVAGNTTLVVTGTGINVAGTVNATGTISGNHSGNFSGNVTTAAQGNITSLGTLTGLTVNGASNLGPVGNVTITGGSANYYLMTNGSGGLSWTNALLTPIPGSNTQVLFNDSGAAGANANLTFTKNNGLLTATLLGGTLTTNAQPNITSTGTLTSLIVTGNINGGNMTLATGVFTGNGAGLTNLAGANVTGAVSYATTANSVAGANVSGTVTSATNAAALLQNTSTSTTVYPTFTTSSANGNSSAVFNTSISANLGNASITATTFVGALSGAATSATTAGTVTTAAQPNITSVGTLTSLGVNGTITAVAFTANTGIFTGNGAGLTNIAGANVTGAVSYATTANSVAGANVSGTVSSATTAGTVTTAAQPNITSVGTLTSLSVSGNISSANLTTSGYTFVSVGTGISAAGTVQGNATVIAKQINVVSTVASGAGVVLPSAVAGMTIYITNTSANSLLVYPASGGAINSLATNAAITQAANSTLHYIAPTTTQWYSVGATYA